MNLGEMLVSLRRQIGNPTVADVTDSVLTEVINTAYKEIVSKHNFRRIKQLCRFNTIQGTSTYNLPSGVDAVLKARNNTDQVRLEKYDALRHMHRTSADVEGHPRFYVLMENFIRLIPTPDEVYEIEVYYRGQLAPLVSNSQSPVIPDSWHSGIVKLARHHYYDEIEGDLVKSKAALESFGIWLSGRVVEADEEKTDFDTGVIIEPLYSSREPRLDFNHED
jgi:hypothetical protein